MFQKDIYKQAISNAHNNYSPSQKVQSNFDQRKDI